MSTVVNDMLASFIDARYREVKRKTWLRDVRVIDELRAAVETVENAGGGVARLADRGLAVTTYPWDGLLTDLDVDVLLEAARVVLRRERPIHRGRTVDTAEDAAIVLRHLGRWMTEWRLGGINALSTGMQFQRAPAPFTLAAAERATPPVSGRAQLRLVSG